MISLKLAAAAVVATLIGVLSFQLYTVRKDLTSEIARNAVLTLEKRALEESRNAIVEQNKNQQAAIRTLQDAQRAADEAETALRLRLDDLMTEGETDETPDLSADRFLGALGALNADVNRMLERETR